VLKVLVVVALLAALVYAVVWTIERRRSVGRLSPRPKPRAVAPDDDEEFLRSLRPEHEPDEDDPEDPRPHT
jgi:hypothetical protein